MSLDAAKGVRWDLNDLYTSPDDPAIQADLKTALELARGFETTYKPLLKQAAKGDSLPLARLLADYKEISRLTSRLGTYASLYFAEDTRPAERGAFLQKIETYLTDIQSHLLFFDVVWNRFDDDVIARLLADPSVADDRHLLEKMRTWAPFTLRENEEKILSVKSLTSGRAFSRLFDETMNNIPFYIEENGQRVKKTEGEVLSLLHSPDRPIRKKASESLAASLKDNSRLLVYVFNMILADHRTDLKLRGYKHPMDAMNLSNEIALNDVQTLIQAVHGAYPVAQRYYSLKKKLLKLDTLYDYDRYAHVEEDGAQIGFDECRRIVLEGYYKFSEEAGRIVEEFFSKRWIDAEIREGKQSGGFCCGTTDKLHPYILVNYTGNIRDVMTVAHELGHGMHQQLARRAGVLEMHAPLTMAETASVFGEMLIFEKLLENEKDPKKRLGLLCGKIDDNFATVFRQIVLTDFEIVSHEAGLKEGELSDEFLCDAWIRANGAMYGQSVTLTDNYRHGWKYISHFIHSPFYCYAYAYAQLFVLSLYQKYKQDKAKFIPGYFEMLSLGGSRKPKDIAAIAGLDISQPNFWQGGLKLLEDLVSEAEAAAK